MTATSPSILRPRGSGTEKRPRRRTLDPTRWTPAVGLAVAGGAPIAGPRLGFPGDDDDRSAWISGSVSVALHAGLLGAIFLTAWLSPKVIEEQTIEVTLLEPEYEPVELPGSNEPSAGPVALAARAPASAAAMAAAMAAAAEAPTPDQLDLSARELQMAQLDARAPTALDRQPVDVERLEAQPDTAVAPRPLDVATLSPVAVDASDLAAPKVDMSAPTAIESAAPTAVSAPQAFAGYQEVAGAQYAGQAATSGTVAPEGASGAYAGQVGVDTGIAGAYAGGGGGGGTGTGSGVPSVECLRSAYVHRYMKEVERRTYARWEHPPDIPTDSTVKLRFKLDVTGSPTAVEFVEATNDQLGSSAVQALRTAAPFPAMDPNVRCLAERNLTATFIANPS